MSPVILYFIFNRFLVYTKWVDGWMDGRMDGWIDGLIDDYYLGY